MAQWISNPAELPASWRAQAVEWIRQDEHERCVAELEARLSQMERQRNRLARLLAARTLARTR